MTNSCEKRMHLSGVFVITLTGLFTPLWWTFLVSFTSNLIYKFIDDQSLSPQVVSFLMIYGPTCFAGLIAGMLIQLSAKRRPLYGWIIYIACFFLSSIGTSIFFGAQSQLVDLFVSPGTIIFLACSLFPPLYYFRKCVGVPKMTVENI